MQRVRMSEQSLDQRGVNAALIHAIERKLTPYRLSRQCQRDLICALRALNAESQSTQCAVLAEKQAEEIAIDAEGDIVKARRAARSLAAALGFGHTDQIKLATVVSELARNIVNYAGCGHVVLKVVQAPSRGLQVEAIDRGPGIARLDQILAGTYVSQVGMGLKGCQKLMCTFHVTSSSEGTHVTTALFL